MKNIILFTLLSFTTVFAAEEASFPTEVAKTELTEEQKAEASKKMDEALAIYDKVLSYDKRGSVEALRKSLKAVDKRIAKSKAALIKHSKSLAKVQTDFHKREQVINSRSYDKKKKEDKLLELHSKFGFYKTYHKNQVDANRARLKRLYVRRTEILESLEELGAELKDQGLDSTLSPAERLREQRLKEMKKDAEKNKQDLIDQAYDTAE